MTEAERYQITSNDYADLIIEHNGDLNVGILNIQKVIDLLNKISMPKGQFTI